MGWENWESWQQQEFDFDFAPVRKKKTIVDYDKLIAAFEKGPLTFRQIQELAGVSKCGVSNIITTLSLHYPIYEYARGIYKLAGDDDYGDGINHDAIKKDYEEW